MPSKREVDRFGCSVEQARKRPRRCGWSSEQPDREERSAARSGRIVVATSRSVAIRDGPFPGFLACIRSALLRHCGRPCFVEKRRSTRESVARISLRRMRPCLPCRIAEVFRALKAFGQRSQIVCSITRAPAKPMIRARFGDMDIAEHGIRGGDAAGRRIGQDDNIGKLGVAQTLHGDRRARHLHQREDPFLHPRATRGGEDDERRAGCSIATSCRDNGLARRHAKRAAQEIEILHRGNDIHALQFAKGELQPRRRRRSWRDSLSRSV